jgi:hypothetical protein
MRNHFYLISQLTVCFCLLYSLANTQENMTSGKYKRYVDTFHKFSFSIPVEWEIIIQEEVPAMAFPLKKYPTDTINYEKEIFSIEIWPEGPCDSAFLRPQGFDLFFPYPWEKDWSSEQGITPDGDLYYINYECAPNLNMQMINGKPVVINPFFKDTTDLRQIISSDTLFLIRGKNWNAYWSKNNCVVSAIRRTIPRGDICESIYFFDGKHSIIQLLTNGNSFEEKVRKNILNSFKFF